MPTSPNIEVGWISIPDLHISKMGARGLSEIGCVGTPAAITNAVFHATGQRIRRLPVTLDKLIDAFSRKIVGWSLQKTMHAQGALNALKMALSARRDISQPLIHHSNRGIQYCSWAYVQRLLQANATINMTESCDPNENAMAERVLHSLKDDCKLARGFTSFSAAEEAVARAINAYNTVRPHASLNYRTGGPVNSPSDAST